MAHVAFIRRGHRTRKDSLSRQCEVNGSEHYYL